MRHKDAGFTLVEVMVVLALLGMLTVLAYGAVSFGAFAWRRTSEHRAKDADRMAVVRVLRESITRAYPAFRSRNPSDLRIRFNGTKDSLELIAPLPEAIEAGVMARERFYVGAFEAGPVLCMDWALDLPAATSGELKPRVVRLADAVSILQLGYFGAVDRLHGRSWHDQWLDMTALPEMVRARIWRVGDTGAPWIDMTVETRTTTNTDCAYDPLDTTCRRLE